MTFYLTCSQIQTCHRLVVRVVYIIHVGVVVLGGAPNLIATTAVLDMCVAAEVQ